MDNAELARMHNLDERFSIINLEKAVQFYIHLIQHA
jgi:acetylornithine deacetylase/succinyl-diaminopimelate desuccinylase-like protein